MPASLFADVPTAAERSFDNPEVSHRPAVDPTSLFYDGPATAVAEQPHEIMESTPETAGDAHTSLFYDEPLKADSSGIVFYLSRPSDTTVSEHESLFIDPYKVKPHVGLPDNAPIVSVDIKLGKKYKEVDFDYESYQRELDRQGMPEDALPMNVLIKRRSIKDRLLARSLGSYCRRHINVSATRDADKTLKHEMQHGVDDNNNILEANDFRYSMGIQAVDSFIPASLGAVSTQISLGLMSYFGKVNAGNLDRAVITAGIVPLLVGGVATWGYSMHPAERRAEKAAKQSPEKILTLTKRHPWYKKIINKYTASLAALTISSVAPINSTANENTNRGLSPGTPAPLIQTGQIEKSMNHIERVTSYKILSSVIEGHDSSEGPSKKKGNG